MPSHRQGNIPKHRARRPDENSGRRLRLNAVIPAKRIAPEPGPDAGDGGSDDSGPRPGRHGRVGRAADGVVAGTRAARPPRRMRGLLVTPWFAAGAGFVIAAALSLNAPRTFLTYRPNNAPHDTRCAGRAGPGCPSPESVPTSRPGVQIKSVNPAVLGGGGAPGPVVAIHVGPEHNGAFSVTFTLPAGQARNGWNLRFTLPGKTISEVVGAARWRADAADDGGVAAISPQGGYVSGTDPAGVSLLVSAAGTPAAPVGCVLNGHACRFRPPP
jgi:hypothetical protein